MVVVFALGACHPPRSVSLDEALRGTRNGDYELIVVSDGLVSFQNRRHKDQYHFKGELPETELIQIRTTIEQSRLLGHSAEFEDLRGRGANHGG